MVDSRAKHRRSRAGRIRAYEPDRIVGKWWCPVCGRAAHRRARPGRPKVYCTNACRQRAYRERCRRRADRSAVETRRPTRARSRDRSHALRPQSDFVSRLSDDSGREITLCGAFARRARRPPWAHTDFVAGLDWSCRTCTELGP